MSPEARNPDPKFAWRELDRQALPKRSAKERLADFLEIHGLIDEARIREQASRCIQCPNPSCVSGCPLCNPIPKWMQLTAEGRLLEAAAVVGSVASMAEVCARVCPSEKLCEHTCILDGISEPVAIASIEQFLADYAVAHGLLDTSTRPPNGFKVAVMGSGPGALVCADELAKLGYAVTVFDSAVVPGGLLVNGTPAFRLDRSIIQRRIDVLRHRGVQFRLGHNLPQMQCLADLRREFQAVYLGLDARQSRTLDVPGASLPGVTQALPLLLQKNTSVALDAPAIELAGAAVAVIGSGDIAIDSARTALRCAAREVTVCCRRDEHNMACGAAEYQNAREEGVKFLFQVSPIAILPTEQGRARSIQFAQTQPAGDDGHGRTAFIPQPGTAQELAVDCVVVALGFTSQPLSSFKGLEDLHVGPDGCLFANEALMTNLPGVFAGGDLVRGPSFVLDTVRDGRNAAASIHQYLSQPVTGS